VNTYKNYYRNNECIGEIKYSKTRKCKYCGGTLVWYDFDEGYDLYACGECNASDVIIDGKVKFVNLF